jgi:hypothetical protein
MRLETVMMKEVEGVDKRSQPWLVTLASPCTHPTSGLEKWQSIRKRKGYENRATVDREWSMGWWI